MKKKDYIQPLSSIVPLLLDSLCELVKASLEADIGDFEEGDPL